MAGKGLLHWLLLDCFGHAQTIEVTCYHIPWASVSLLSPQALLSLGWHSSPAINKYSLNFLDNITLESPYGCANLPIFP